MPEIGNLENKLLDEIHGMREDFRRMSVEMAQLAAEVRHLNENQVETRGHGERITRLEESVTNLKADQRSAATERRWTIGTIIFVVIGMLGIAATLLVALIGHWK